MLQIITKKRLLQLRSYNNFGLQRKIQFLKPTFYSTDEKITLKTNMTLPTKLAIK